MNHSLVEIFKSKRPDKNVIFWNVDDAYSQNPFAFGTVRNLNIAVPISYREYWNTHPDEAQSILEHEFAHLLNGDTWKQSLSKAFIVIVIFGTLIYWLSDTRDDYWYAVDPTGAAQISNNPDASFNIKIINVASLFPGYSLEGIDFSGNYEDRRMRFLISVFPILFFDIAKILLCLFVYFLCIRILLRTQEFYADAYASMDQKGSTFKRALIRRGIAAVNLNNANHSKSKKPIFKSRIKWLDRLFRFHPSFQERIISLSNTQKTLYYFSLVSLVGGVIIEAFNCITKFQWASIKGGKLLQTYFIPLIFGLLLLTCGAS